MPFLKLGFIYDNKELLILFLDLELDSVSIVSLEKNNHEIGKEISALFSGGPVMLFQHFKNNIFSKISERIIGILFHLYQKRCM